VEDGCFGVHLAVLGLVLVLFRKYYSIPAQDNRFVNSRCLGTSAVIREGSLGDVFIYMLPNRN